MKYLMAHKKGQNVFEYVILLAGVILVLIVFLNPGGIFRQTVENHITDVVNQIGDMVNSLNFD